MHRTSNSQTVKISPPKPSTAKQASQQRQSKARRQVRPDTIENRHNRPTTTSGSPGHTKRTGNCEVRRTAVEAGPQQPVGNVGATQTNPAPLRPNVGYPTTTNEPHPAAKLPRYPTRNPAGPNATQPLPKTKPAPCDQTSARPNRDHHPKRGPHLRPSDGATNYYKRPPTLRPNVGATQTNPAPLPNHYKRTPRPAAKLPHSHATQPRPNAPRYPTPTKHPR